MKNFRLNWLFLFVLLFGLGCGVLQDTVADLEDAADVITDDYDDEDVQSIEMDEADDDADYEDDDFDDPTFSSSDLSAALTDLLTRTIAPDEPGAVVLIGTPTGTTAVAYGLADLSTGTPLQTTDRFRIASTSKPFLAVIILQLYDEGLLNLDDPIADYLPPDFVDNLANADTATIRQILNMTSGIPDYLLTDEFDDATYANPNYPWAAIEALQFALLEPASFAPGTDYEYSNSNYLIGELIIQEVTGDTLANQLQTRIFTPLGMTNTYQEDPTNIGAGLVRGYADDFEDVTEFNNGVGLGDGGIISTAADLALFLPALFDGRLLSAGALAEMLTTVPDDEGGDYGLGIVYPTSAHGEVYGHSGLSGGFTSEMNYLPAQRIIVIVLANSETADYTPQLADQALLLALGR